MLDGIRWLSENLAFSFVIGLFCGVFLIDVCWSLDLLVKIRKFAAENDIIVRYERLRSELRARTDEYRNRRKITRLLPSLSSGKNLNEILQEYMDNLKKEIRTRHK